MRTRRWVLGFAAALALLAIGGWLTFRWLFGMPPRPRGVDGTYSFVWLDTGMPRNKGVWMACVRALQADTAGCRVVNQQGKLEREAQYRTYPAAAPLPAGPLRVDPSTNWYDGVSILNSRGEFLAYAPFIRLTGGTVLLPAAAYDEAAAKYREEHRSAKSAPPG